MSQSSTEADQAVRDLRSNLNKITDSNYQSVANAIFETIKKASTDSITEMLANTFFRKTIIDESFCHLYTRMVIKIKELGFSTFIYTLKENIKCFAESDPMDTEKIKSLKTHLDSAKTVFLIIL